MERRHCDDLLFLQMTDIFHSRVEKPREVQRSKSSSNHSAPQEVILKLDAHEDETYWKTLGFQSKT